MQPESALEKIKELVEFTLIDPKDVKGNTRLCTEIWRIVNAVLNPSGYSALIYDFGEDNDHQTIAHYILRYGPRIIAESGKRRPRTGGAPSYSEAPHQALESFSGRKYHPVVQAGSAASNQITVRFEEIIE